MPNHFLQLLSPAKVGSLAEVNRLLKIQSVSDRLTKSTEAQWQVLSAAVGSGSFDVFRHLSEYLDAPVVRYHLAADRKKMLALLQQAIEAGDLRILKLLLDTHLPASPTRLKKGMAALAKVPEKGINSLEHHEHLETQELVLVSTLKGDKLDILKYFLTQSQMFAGVFNINLYFFSSYNPEDGFLKVMAFASLKILKFLLKTDKISIEQKARFIDIAAMAGNPNIVQCILDIPHNKFSLLQSNERWMENFIGIATKNMTSLKAVLKENILSYPPKIIMKRKQEEPNIKWMQEKMLVSTTKNLGSEGLELLLKEVSEMVFFLKSNEEIRFAVLEAAADRQETDTLRYLLGNPYEIPFSQTLRYNAEMQRILLSRASDNARVDLLEYLLSEREEVLQFLIKNKREQLDFLKKTMSSASSLEKINCLFCKIKGMAEDIELLTEALNCVVPDFSVGGDRPGIEFLLNNLRKRGVNYQFSYSIYGWQKKGSSGLDVFLSIEALRSQIASFDNRILHDAIQYQGSDVVRRILKEPEVRTKIHVLNHKAMRLTVENGDKILVSILIEIYRERGIPLPKDVKIKEGGKEITLKEFLDKSLLSYSVFYQKIARQHPQVHLPSLPLEAVNLIQEFSGTVRTESITEQLLSCLSKLQSLQARLKEEGPIGDPKQERELEIQKMIALQKKYRLTPEYPMSDSSTLREEIEKALGRNNELSNRIIEEIMGTASCSSFMDIGFDLAEESIRRPAISDNVPTDESRVLVFSKLPNLNKEGGSKSSISSSQDEDIKERCESEAEQGPNTPEMLAAEESGSDRVGAKRAKKLPSRSENEENAPSSPSKNKGRKNK